MCVREREIECVIRMWGVKQRQERGNLDKRQGEFHTCHAPCAYTHPFHTQLGGKQNKLRRTEASVLEFCSLSHPSFTSDSLPVNIPEV